MSASVKIREAQNKYRDERHIDVIRASIDGIKLPTDFSTLVGALGDFCIGGFLWIFSPLSENSHTNLLKQIEEVGTVWREFLFANADYTVYPEVGGMIIFGVTDNGDQLFWRPDSNDPDRWPVYCVRARSGHAEIAGKSFDDFIDGVIRRKEPYSQWLGDDSLILSPKLE